MTISLKHKFNSPKADGGDASLVRPSNWNDEHDITLAASRLLGRYSGSAGAAQEITLGAGLSFSTSNLVVDFEAWADFIAAATIKSVPIAADKFGYYDSVSGDARAITFSDLTLAYGAAIGPDYVEGGILSNNAGTPLTHVDVAAFKVKGQSKLSILAVGLTKNINGTWVAGNAGGLDAGVKAANATYFTYALRKQSDGSGEVVFSTSPTVAGVVTTLLAGYDVICPIGVILTDGSSNIRAFTMNIFDQYIFTAPVKDAVGLSVSATSALLALTVPNGVKSEAIIRFQYQSSATTASMLLHDTAQGVLTAGIGADGANVGAIQVASSYAVGSGKLWTNTAKQIRQVAGAGGSLWVWTDGFRFPCKRIA